jgi:hypothetical protein
MDAATGTAATLGANPPRIIRREGHPRVSLISNARGKGTAGFGAKMSPDTQQGMVSSPPDWAIRL